LLFPMKETLQFSSELLRLTFLRIVTTNSDFPLIEILLGFSPDGPLDWLGPLVCSRIKTPPPEFLDRVFTLLPPLGQAHFAFQGMFVFLFFYGIFPSKSLRIGLPIIASEAAAATFVCGPHVPPFPFQSPPPVPFRRTKFNRLPLQRPSLSLP